MCVCVCRYCPDCKTNAGEVIQAGEKMRLTKKKANMQSKKGTCQRDWGKVGPLTLPAGVPCWGYLCRARLCVCPLLGLPVQGQALCVSSTDSTILWLNLTRRMFSLASQPYFPCGHTCM